MNQFFNFLKGLAALCVFLLHFCYVFGAVNPNVHAPAALYTPAWVGVWIFFVLSGYMIGSRFWAGAYKTDTAADFGKFYLKRIVRIAPIYFLIVIIDMLFINTHLYFNGSPTLWRAFTFTLRNPFADYMTGNLWFVATIVWLYLMTPLIWKFVLKPLSGIKNSAQIMLAVAIMLALGYLGLRLYWWNAGVSWDYFILVNPLANIDLFFGAFILSRFSARKQDTAFKKIARPVILHASCMS